MPRLSLTSFIFYFFVIIWSQSSIYYYCLRLSWYHYRLNVTEDLFSDTLSNNSSSFNLTNWFCWDFFASNQYNYVNSKYDLGHCSCFINVKCTNSNNNNDNEAQSTNNLELTYQSPLSSPMIWFRCYDLQDSILLSKFIQTLPQNLFIHSGKEPSKCMLQATKHINKIFSLRADFIRCNKSHIFKFIKEIDQEPKHYSLESLTIRESGLDEIPTWLFQKFNYLKSLNLTSNKLNVFNSTRDLPLVDSMLPGQLMTIDLSNNRLTHVDLSRFRSLRSINLSQNYLTTLSKNDLPNNVITLLENIKSNNQKALLDLSIGNNPWNCNHNIDWLIDLISFIVETNGRSYFYEPNASQVNSGRNNLHHVELFQTNEPECDQPLEAKMFPFSVWKSVKESPICGRCNCYLKDKYAKVGYRYVLVNCTNRNLLSLPAKLPKNTKILDLSNNYIRNLNPLSKYHHVELSKWGHVNKIILSNNSLETLNGLELIRSIVFLDISGNLLTEIPYHIINKVLSSNKIDKFSIGNNPYICDCNTVKMQKWLQNNYRIILDIKQVRCGYFREELTRNESYYSSMVEQAKDSKFFNKEILHINSLHLCPSSDTVIDTLDIINLVLAISILLLIIKATYDFFWQKRTGKLPQFFKLNI